MDANSPNREQAEYWSEEAGPKWVAEKASLDNMIKPYGDAVIERAKLQGSESILDVGCGTGQTSLQLAERVPNGRVHAVDISESMLARAEQEAKARKLSNLRFERADAQTHAFEPSSFDLAFSRFGVMFFADPTAAFSNIRRALKPSGELRFVCWQPLSENAWISIPLGVASKHASAAGAELPPRPAPGAPGPLSLGDPERLRGILDAAGFKDVELEDSRIALALGAGTLEDAVVSATQLGPAAALVKSLEPAVRAEIAEALRTELKPYMTADGVRLGSGCWLVSARPA